ncbi:MAG: acyl-CoA dehydrogenase family protein [Candidatus Azotimanducaceae bacterium WSBS_2022_MAG_OTU7]
MSQLRSFRDETRAWLDENCPASMRTRMVEGEQVNGGRKKPGTNPDAYTWLERMHSRGWTVPTWPRQYGGAALTKEKLVVLVEELQRIGARPPLGGMGVTMIGPTLLEYGTVDQKERHLPKIASGDIAWCQGYSEPGAGSDLASLRTRAEDKGDHYLVNGSKIWTSGANHADWIFCLVRTDFDAPKHDGISFVLFSMDSDGVTTKPIRLISGNSPFCETFFDDVHLPKEDLVHKPGQGWTVAKRLLQHERSGLEQMIGGEKTGVMERINPGGTLHELAQRYNGGACLDADLRDEITRINMQLKAFNLTRRRTVDESDNNTPGAATSIFKYVEAELVKEQLELQIRIRGTQGLGWEGDVFSVEEISKGRLWLESKSISIAGGTNEVQLNIIAKRVLGLPD